jgi:hypothetical protein
MMPLTGANVLGNTDGNPPQIELQNQIQPAESDPANRGRADRRNQIEIIVGG